MISRRVVTWLFALSLLAVPGASDANTPVNIAQLPAPPLDTASSLVEKFLKEELARLNKGESSTPADIAAVCTLQLEHLIAIERARGKAYGEGFEDAKGDPRNLPKPIFSNGGYFVNCIPEGVMSVKAEPPQLRGKKVAVPVKFTSRIGDKSYDMGGQVMILSLENGRWLIDDVEPPNDFSLIELLKRPKYMDLPEKKKP
ncbi:MAG TPA: hypothetical protein VK956_08435 [Verrucomicrobium sp.]|nr:hypothetical protein [Verrucomicrobium sp.]